MSRAAASAHSVREFHPGSSEHLFHHVAANISEAEIASLEFVRQAKMINTQAMQDGGLQVVDVYRIFEDIIGIFISLAHAQAFLDPAASHPNGEAARVMIAAIVRGAELALAIHGAAKFAGPYDECVIQHAALLEIEHQSGRGLIDAFALQRDVSRQVVVLVPASMIELNEAHAALGKPPC